MLDFLEETELPDATIRSTRVYERLYYHVAAFLRGRVFIVTFRGRYDLAQEGVARGDIIGLVGRAPVAVTLPLFL